MSITFLQLNIERQKHVDKLFDFLEKNSFDVLCLQEILEDTAELISKRFGYTYVFSKYLHKSGDGVAIFSKSKEIISDETLLISSNPGYWNGEGCDFSLLSGEIVHEDISYRFLTAHLPVNYPGEVVSKFQRDCYSVLKEKLKEKEPFLFLSDTNAPRGTYIFDDLAKTYTDNVPTDIDSTIDPVLHKVKNILYVVDCAFSTPNYKVSDVVVHTGLSDHKGISGVLTVVKD